MEEGDVSVMFGVKNSLSRVTGWKGAILNDGTPTWQNLSSKVRLERIDRQTNVKGQCGESEDRAQQQQPDSGATRNWGRIWVCNSERIAPPPHTFRELLIVRSIRGAAECPPGEKKQVYKLPTLGNLTQL